MSASEQAPGRFITLEGGEGAGKSTQARLLAEALRARGLEVVLTREPGGTPGAEAIRALLLDGEHSWGPRAEALLFAAARADHVEKLIRPALERGAWVVCDRFLDSSRAYQAGGFSIQRWGWGIDDAEIRSLHTIGSVGLLPDMTLLVVVSPEIAGKRLIARDAGVADRIGGRSASYHARVADAFIGMSSAEPDRFRVVNGNAHVRNVHAAIMDAIAPLLGDTA